MKKTITVALIAALFAASTPVSAESFGEKIKRNALQTWDKMCKAGEEICQRIVKVGEKAYTVVEDIADFYKSMLDVTSFEFGSYTVYPTLGIAVKTEKLKQYEQAQQQKKKAKK